MAMLLAIGTPTARLRNPRATADPRSARLLADDPMDGRPPIPRGVVTWPDVAPPAQAGDPALAIDGPPPLARARDSMRRIRLGGRLESVAFAAVLAGMFAASSLAFVDVARTIGYAQFGAPAAGAAATAVVTTRVLSVQMLEAAPPQSASATATRNGG